MLVSAGFNGRFGRIVLSRGVSSTLFKNVPGSQCFCDLGIPKFQKGFSTVWLKELDLRIPRLIESV